MGVYDRMAAAYEAYAADSAWNAHYDRPAVLQLIGPVVGLRVLDAGCGPGLYAEELLAGGAEVTAFDASPAMVELARGRLGTRAEVVRADLDAPLPFGDGTFDVVVCPLAIHHVANRAAAFRELHRVVRPDGVVVVSTTHPTSDWLRKGGSYFDLRREEDVWRLGGDEYTVGLWREPLGSLCASVADAGFLIERLVEPLPADSMRERAAPSRTTRHPCSRRCRSRSWRLKRPDRSRCAPRGPRQLGAAGLRPGRTRSARVRHPAGARVPRRPSGRR